MDRGMTNVVCMELILGGLAVLTAAFLAGVVGFAYGLVALPLLILVGIPLEVVVPINLAIALTARLLVLRLNWSSVAWPRALRLALGSVPGAAVGVAAAAAVSKSHLQVIAGVVVLLAVFAMAVTQRRKARASSAMGQRAGSAVAEVCAGAAGGLLGSTTSLNGVPPALLMTLRRAPARNVVADLAVYFIVANLAALGLLQLAGRVAWGTALPFIACWLPLALLATSLGTRLGPRLPRGAFRRLTLTLVVVSAVTGLVHGLGG